MPFEQPPPPDTERCTCGCGFVVHIMLNGERVCYECFYAKMRKGTAHLTADLPPDDSRDDDYGDEFALDDARADGFDDLQLATDGDRWGQGK